MKLQPNGLVLVSDLPFLARSNHQNDVSLEGVAQANVGGKLQSVVVYRLKGDSKLYAALYKALRGLFRDLSTCNYKNTNDS